MAKEKKELTPVEAFIKEYNEAMKKLTETHKMQVVWYPSLQLQDNGAYGIAIKHDIQEVK